VFLIGLFIQKNWIEFFASAVNCLQMGIGKVCWQMMGLMIGHIFMEDLEHETSSDHVLNMTTWYDLRNNLEKG